MAELPSQDYLKSRIDYNPETGEARWKPIDDRYTTHYKAFNAKKAGKLLEDTTATLDGVNYTVSKLLYKLHYGIDPKGNIIFLDKNRKNYVAHNMTLLEEKIPRKVVGPSIPASEKRKRKIDSELAKHHRMIPEEITKRIHYSHTTGVFIWLPRENDPAWTARYAYSTAGSVVHGYPTISYNNKQYKAHRVAWLAYYGVDPGPYQIDHINRIPVDNRIKNLRLAIGSLNGYNQDRTKYSGVRVGSDGRFISEISVVGITTHLGRFDTYSEAEKAFKQASKQYRNIYKFTPEEQAELDELYAAYPNVSRELQHRCHALQVKAINHYIEGATQ